jgi:hypothetical protein
MIILIIKTIGRVNYGRSIKAEENKNKLKLRKTKTQKKKLTQINLYPTNKNYITELPFKYIIKNYIPFGNCYTLIISLKFLNFGTIYD